MAGPKPAALPLGDSPTLFDSNSFVNRMTTFPWSQGRILPADEESFKRYLTAFDDYLAQKFEEAKNVFQDLHNKYPEDKSSKRLLEACENYISNPPGEDWDGVVTFTTK